MTCEEFSTRLSYTLRPSHEERKVAVCRYGTYAQLRRVSMTKQRDALDRLLKSIAKDWRGYQRLGQRLALAKTAGVPWRTIASRTGIPMTNARRWAQPYLNTQSGPEQRANADQGLDDQPANPGDHP